MKTIKNFCLTALAAAATAFLIPFAASAQYAQGYTYGTVSQPTISTALFSQTTTTNGSTITTNYAGSPGVSKFVWTNSIAGDYTNLTLLSAAGTRELAIEFSGQQFTNSAGATPLTNVLIRLARNVRGFASVNNTNGVTGPQGIQFNGAPLPYEVFAQITNTVNITNLNCTVIHLTGSVPAVAIPNVLQLAGFQDGAIPNIYLLDVQTTTGVILTNFSVYVSAN